MSSRPQLTERGAGRGPSPAGASPGPTGAEGGAVGVPGWLAVSSAIAGRALILTAAVAVLLWVLTQLALPVLAFLVALPLVTLLEPVARILRRHGLPPAAAAAVTLIGALVALIGVFVALVVPVVDQFDNLREDLQAGVAALDETLSTLPGGLDINLDELWAEAASRVNENVEMISAQLFSGARVAVEVVAGALLCLATTFFLLKDSDQITAWLTSRTPAGIREDVRAAGGRAWVTLASYVRGQMIVAAADAIGIGIGLLVIGVPLVLPLAALTFFGAFIPVVGALLAGVAVVLIAFVDGGLTQALLALAIVVVVQQLESNLLAPVVLGRTLPLHPLVVLLAVTAGAVIAGIIGALIAVPVSAVIVAVLGEVRSRHGVTPA